MTTRRAALGAGLIVCAVLIGLAGYMAFTPLMGPSIPDANFNAYGGRDRVSVTIEITQSNCCYVEGSERFAILTGASEDEWLLTSESSSITVAPGDYELTLYERGCNGWCHPTMLEPPTNHCSAQFHAEHGVSVIARVDFPIPKPCVMEIESSASGA